MGATRIVLWFAREKNKREATKFHPLVAAYSSLWFVLQQSFFFHRETGFFLLSFACESEKERERKTAYVYPLVALLLVASWELSVLEVEANSGESDHLLEVVENNQRGNMRDVAFLHLVSLTITFSLVLISYLVIIPFSSFFCY